MPNQLKTLIEGNKNARGTTGIYNSDNSFRHSHTQPAASVHVMSMRELSFPEDMQLDLAQHKAHCPIGFEAGKKTTLAAAIMQHSRVVAAGAHLVILEAASEAIPTGKQDVVLLKQRTDGFSVIEAANFAAVADGDEVSETPTSNFVFRSTVDFDTLPSYGFRVKLTRAQMTDFVDGRLADETLAAIAFGLANLCDRVLLAAIAALPATQFNFGLAAASGLKFSELAAFIGTTGTGAYVSDAGDLRCTLQANSLIQTGLAAQLTSEIAPSVIGAFNRAAVAVSEEITLTAERLNVNGDQFLTCWVNAQAMVPRANVFWRP